MKELDVLYETVIDRKANGEEGSYTSYLFNKGLDKIIKKSGRKSCTEVVNCLLITK